MFTLFSLLALAPAPQSAFADRVGQAVDVTIDGDGETISMGQINLSPLSGSTTSQLAWWVDPAQDTLPATTLSIDLESVGSIVPVGGSGYLAMGTALTPAGDVGRMIRFGLDVDAGAFTVLSTRDFAGMDPIHGYFDPSMGSLYLVDGVSRALLATAYDGGVVLPTTFDVVADHTVHAPLATPRKAFLDRNPALPGVRLFDATGVRYASITPNGPSFAFDGDAWASVVDVPIVFTPSMFVPANRPFELSASGAATYPHSIVMKSSSGTEAQWAIASPTEAVSLPAGAGTPGRFVWLQSASGQSLGRCAITCVKHGATQNPGVLNLGEVYCDLAGPYEGASDSMLIVDVLPSLDGGLTIDGTMNGEVRIGFHVPGTAGYPVVESGSAATLTASMTIPFQLDAGPLPTELSFDLPQVPQGSAGILVLFQVAVQGQNGIASSEVFGLPIRSVNPLTSPM